MAASNASPSTTPRELIIAREFDAPRELVFKVWTDPKHVAVWWGPHGFTNPVCALDARPGGAIRIDMRGPDGTVYPMTGVFEELVEPERLVFKSSALDASGKPLFEILNTVTFEERGGKTLLRLRALVLNATPAAAPHLGGMEIGWTQTLERLDAYVAKVSGKGETTSAAKSSPAGSTADREIVFTRVFDAPRELVWEAFTDPKHVIRWWGPNGFSTTIQEMDVRPGGEWRHVMHGPDGADYPNYSVFLEVVRPERLVYSHGGRREGGGPEAEFVATVTFEAQGSKTRLTMQLLFPSAEVRNRVAQAYGAVEGGKQTLQRLSEYLPTMDAGLSQSGARPFVITRVFDAPRELVWKACTEPERLKQWWGPSGFEWIGCTLDLRPGGMFHYSMRGPNAHELWGKFVYREVVAPERLVFVNSFSDKHGGLARHPMSPTWPLEVLNVMTLAEENGKTVLTLSGAPINASAEEIRTFEGGFESMEKGFGATFDQLAEYLAQL